MHPNHRRHRAISPLVLVKSGDELRSKLGSLGLLDLGLAKLLGGKLLGVGVEPEQNLLVDERVLLLDSSTLGDGAALDGAEDGLNLRGVDERGNVGLLDNGGREEEVLLERRRLSGGAVDLVKSLESGRGPDNEAAQVTTRSELEEVEGVDGRGLDTGNVAESRDELLAVGLGVVDDQRTAALAVAAATELTLTGTELLRGLDLLDISTGTDSLQEGDGSGGLGDGSVGESGRGNDEGNLGDGGDVVTTSQQQSGAGRSSQGRGGSEAPTINISCALGIALYLADSLLAEVDLLVPLPPDFGGSEHAARAALVTKGSLTSTVGTTAGDTGDTGDGTTCLMFPSAYALPMRMFSPVRARIASNS